MTILDSLAPGKRVRGLAGNSIATIQTVTRYGTDAIELIARDDSGNLIHQLCYRNDEQNLELVEEQLPWTFDGDGELLRLVSEAYRIRLAHLFDPYLAVYASEVDPLPHQITAVYQEMLPRQPLRYVLADDPGAGKTIMTGLYISELLIRGDLKRCLIVCPGSLAEQWQDELYQKFHLRFEILTNDRYESAASGNVFSEINFAIARLDKLARNDDLQEKLKAGGEWDLIVCDEAHKMSASYWGNEIHYTKRHLLGQLLSQLCRHFLLLTATPHNGKESDFQLFMSLIDPDRFEGVPRDGRRVIDISDVMRRLVKEELLTFEGKKLFPERFAHTVRYRLSPLESELYEEVTNYVREEFNRADRVTNERRTTVGFALTVLQRRLASSPEAIYQSLKRRRERLETQLSEKQIGSTFHRIDWDFNDDEYDADDYSASEQEENETQITDQATAATTIEELQAEIQSLLRLENLAQRVRASGEDKKWEQLSRLLQDEKAMRTPSGAYEKLIIFTEHRDTLNYLRERITTLIGDPQALVVIHGGLHRDARREVEANFKQNPDVRILVATDAAGEGINLQRAHLMINYDLPWNPNRLEQRFGRIHRIGQTEVCHLWNLVASDTREGMVFERLLEKLEQARLSLGGKVFDVLGRIDFDNRPLRDLLLEAVRYGNDPAVRQRINETVDRSFDRQQIEELIRNQVLTDNIMDIHQVNEVREEMEIRNARRLQPHFIESFFLAAFHKLRGRLSRREGKRYEAIRLPASLRGQDYRLGNTRPVLDRYERICFDKEAMRHPGNVTADLMVPSHPLMKATIDRILTEYGDVLKQGATLVDSTGKDETIRLLFYIEYAIQDAVVLDNGQKRTISRQLHFVELRQDGSAVDAGAAPFLDYRPLKAEEQDAAKAILAREAWLQSGIEQRATSLAISKIIPEHLEPVKKDRLLRIQKVRKAVNDRLTTEIQYWYHRSTELAEQERMGLKNDRLNASNARARAQELEKRLNNRLAELKSEEQIAALPPLIVGGAIIVPETLLHKADASESEPDTYTVDPVSRRMVEEQAVQAVMEVERSLGFEPRDIGTENRGFDIYSMIPEGIRDGGHSFRAIEVKGRTVGSRTVTVTKNEILTALNLQEQFILALVEVDGSSTRIRYLQQPFTSQVDFATVSVNYDIDHLIRQSAILLDRRLT